MLVDSGVDRVRALIMSRSTDAIVNMKLGTSATAADAAQTDLIAAVLTQSVIASYGPLSAQMTFTAVFQSDGSNYREVGLFTSDGTMIFRKVIALVTYAVDNLFIVQVTLTLS